MQAVSFFAVCFFASGMAPLRGGFFCRGVVGWGQGLSPQVLYNVSYRFKTYSALIFCRFVGSVLLNRNVYGKKKAPCKITRGSCYQKDLFCYQKCRLCYHYMSFCFFCLWFFVFKKTIFTAYFIKAKANFIGSVKRKAVHSPAL